MTKLVPPLTKTLFTLAVAVPVLLSLEGVKDMAAADAFAWAGFVFKTLSAGAANAMALLSFHQLDPNRK